MYLMHYIHKNRMNLWNFIGAVMRHKRHNYNGNIWSKSEDVYKS